MAVTGFAWNQGEANAGSSVYYTCAQPALVSSWRDAFRNPTAYFGFVMIGGSWSCVAAHGHAWHALLAALLLGVCSAVCAASC